jgi:hypothetical protein
LRLARERDFAHLALRVPNFELAKDGSFRVKRSMLMFSVISPTIASQDCNDNIVRFAIRAKVEGRANPCCNGVASDLRTFRTLRRE